MGCGGRGIGLDCIPWPVKERRQSRSFFPLQREGDIPSVPWPSETASRPKLRKIIREAVYTVPAVGNGPSNRAYKTLQNLLRRARKSAKLTQKELSLRLNRPQSFVSKYERGERGLDVIEFADVARALGIDPLQFLKKFYREVS